MKKIIFIVSLLLCVSFNALGQIRACCYFDGYWSEWMNLYDVHVYGNYEGFVMHTEKEGPWNYRFKFTIHNFNVPDKKQRKKDIKDDKFYVFSGTVEYYISDNYPSVLSLFRAEKKPIFVPAKLSNGRPTKKITSNATIKVAAFKDLPTIYNIFFDGVALGINLNTIRFSHDVKYK